MADKILTFNGKTISGPSGTGIVLIKEPEPVQGVTIGGRTYRTVTIGNQEWMAENLDYKFEGCTYRDGIDGNEIEGDPSLYETAYYNYDPAQGQGLLYGGDCGRYINANSASLGIPEGWRVPSDNDANLLITTVGAIEGVAKLKSTTGWINNGTDQFGFCAKPAGEWVGSFEGINTINPYTSELENYLSIWSSTYHEEDYGYRSLYIADSIVDLYYLNEGGAQSIYLRSIRLMRDIT